MEWRSVLRNFSIVSLFGIGPALYLVINNDQNVLHNMLNKHHDALFDPIFLYGTNLADGLVPLILALSLILLRDVRSGLLVGVACGISGLFVQLLKTLFGHDRPSMFLNEMPDLRLVDGLELAHHYSFPSGHAATAFSLCLTLSFLIKRPTYTFILAIIACLIAYSRVWLSQHYLQDVITGAIIGILFAWGSYHFLYLSSWSKDRHWLDRSLARRTTQ